ncbi:MAG: hypothetical protein M0P73_18815, partial [Syntrophobacterales bacterium]|nr:hypothetical protein [Syntrophobacterales bacterium]
CRIREDVVSFFFHLPAPQEPLRNNLTLYDHFVTAPYAVLFTQVTMLFINNGLVYRMMQRKIRPFVKLKSG